MLEHFRALTAPTTRVFLLAGGATARPDTANSRRGAVTVEPGKQISCGLLSQLRVDYSQLLREFRIKRVINTGRNEKSPPPWMEAAR